MIILNDRKYKYISFFNPDNGSGIRSNIYDDSYNDTGEEPFMGSFPELLDVGIMGHCVHGKSGLCLKSGVQCYQNGIGLSEDNMPFEKYRTIIDECKGKTFQVALGGRGDPDMHEDFVNILRYSRENGVVPNFTTSGFGFKEELLPAVREYCGAAAVSWYRNDYTYRTIELFVSFGIKTNIHYCLSKSTIDEAISIIENKSYHSGINRIIFLLHKPVGLGTKENVLDASDPKVKYFFSLFDNAEVSEKAGFDSCSVPALLSFTNNLLPECIEACEAGRFSAYISPDFRLYPCSFEKNPAFGIPIEDNGIEGAWNSAAFDSFRNRQKNTCNGCPKYKSCFGGCPIVPQITLCSAKHKYTDTEAKAI